MFVFISGEKPLPVKEWYLKQAAWILSSLLTQNIVSIL
jgi:hypothetical protein